MEKANQDHRRQLSREILTDMKEWRRHHPKATLRDVEDEMHTQMSRLEAQMIQDTSRFEPGVDQASKGVRPTWSVEKCLHTRGKQKRRLQRVGEHESRVWSLSGRLDRLHTLDKARIVIIAEVDTIFISSSLTAYSYI